MIAHRNELSLRIELYWRFFGSLRPYEFIFLDKDNKTVIKNFTLMKLFLDSYCLIVDDNKERNPSSQKYTTSKNGRTILKATYVSCAIKKNRFVKVGAGVGI